MKVLLTGANGNLGSNITSVALNYGISIIPIGRHQWKDAANVSCKVDAVIHCAADIKSEFSDAPKSFVDSNINSTINILEICSKKNIKNFYFTSSCAVYGPSSISQESQKKQPMSLNGIIKSLNEEIIEKYCLSNDIAYTIFRIFNLYGDNDNFSVLSKLINSARNKIPFTLTNNGLAERDFVHVTDVSNIICKTVLDPNFSGFLNIGTGNSTKILDIVSAVEEKFGSINILNASDGDLINSKADVRLLKNFLGDITFRNILEDIKSLPENEK